MTSPVTSEKESGTAEPKVPFEGICLADAVQAGVADEAVLVLGGEGWTLRDFYTGGGLAKDARSYSA
ncbi:MAG: hypothetical protein U0Q55_10305 [Vicinamibacterales bacterium]